jgi:hypothetical protein
MVLADARVVEAELPDLKLLDSLDKLCFCFVLTFLFPVLSCFSSRISSECMNEILVSSKRLVNHVVFSFSEVSSS